MMMDFYGFKYDAKLNAFSPIEKIKNDQSDNQDEMNDAAQRTITNFINSGHNHMRIRRILTSLHNVGLSEIA
jgi:hypothetical protein